MINIEEVGSYVKDGDTIKTLVITTGENIISTLTRSNYHTNVKMYLISNTETFNADTISAVSSLEDLTKLTILKELAANGHIIITEITKESSLKYIHECMMNKIKLDLNKID